jgi:hypothetical protein
MPPEPHALRAIAVEEARGAHLHGAVVEMTIILI